MVYIVEMCFEELYWNGLSHQYTQQLKFLLSEMGCFLHVKRKLIFISGNDQKTKQTKIVRYKSRMTSMPLSNMMCNGMVKIG